MSGDHVSSPLEQEEININALFVQRAGAIFIFLFLERYDRLKPTRFTVSKTCTSPIVALPGYAR